MNYFSSNLKYLRKQKNISQNLLAKKINVNQSTIKRWEDNVISPSIENAETIAIFFDVSMSDLTGTDLSGAFNERPQEILFNRYKHILTESDWAIINTIIEQKKKETNIQRGR